MDVSGVTAARLQDVDLRALGDVLGRHRHRVLPVLVRDRPIGVRLLQRRDFLGRHRAELGELLIDGDVTLPGFRGQARERAHLALHDGDETGRGARGVVVAVRRFFFLGELEDEAGGEHARAVLLARSQGVRVRGLELLDHRPVVPTRDAVALPVADAWRPVHEAACVGIWVVDDGHGSPWILASRTINTEILAVPQTFGAPRKKVRGFKSKPAPESSASLTNGSSGCSLRRTFERFRWHTCLA